jgi:hypothetical protein
MSVFANTSGGVIVNGIFAARQNPQQTEFADDAPQVLAFRAMMLENARAKRISAAAGVRLPADRSTTLGAYQDCTGLSFPLSANAHYSFYFDGAYFTAANTTGLHVAVNGPANSFLGVTIEIGTSTTAWLSRVVGSYDVGVEPTASAAATRLPLHIVGNVSTTAAGLLIVRFKSEVPGSAVTIVRGSQGLLVQVN